MGKSLAIFGTASDVGKSIIATALCRIFADRKIKVAPFKAQNMSNNSFVTLDGYEMGVAQAIQAFASRIAPSYLMNPVLLKPSSDVGSQVVLNGKPIGNVKAKDYFKNTDFLFEQAKKGFNLLKDKYELVVIEGAGSCAEVNLKGRDFANFKMAHFANANVLLIADIDKGGVFAQIVGTLECLDKKDRDLVKGIIINKFRGDISLFEDGIKFIEEKTKLPVLGVVPYFRDILIDSEDSLSINSLCDKTEIVKNAINIAIIKLPHISNFTDFSAFLIEDSVRVHYLSKPKDLSLYDAVIVPGTKSTISDLKWIKDTGWDRLIIDYANKGGYVFGICGGYQMFGRVVEDEFGVESNKKTIDGLGLIDAKTTLEKQKVLTNIEGFLINGNIPVYGYEIHMGKTIIPKGNSAVRIVKRNQRECDAYDGFLKKNIWGFYIHGIFDDYKFRHFFLESVAKNKFKNKNRVNYKDFRDEQYDKMANLFLRSVDFDKLLKVMELQNV